MMKSRKKQFIAGAVCPNCDDVDSLVLYSDDQSIECVSCNFLQTSEQRDHHSEASQANKANIDSDKKSYKDATQINILNLSDK